MNPKSNRLLQEKVFLLLLNILITIIYVISAKIGLSFAFLNPSATAIWPPTGIALVALLFFGFRVTPAIFLGAFLANSLTAGTIATSLGIATGNMLEALVGAYLVKKLLHGVHALDTVANIFTFTLIAIFSPLLSATIGVTTLVMGGLADWNTFGSIWTTWWLGDMGGNLIIAPLLLIWGNNLMTTINYKKTLHFIIAFCSLYIVCELIFSGLLPYAYLCIPVAIWIAFWFGQKGTTFTTLFVATIAIFYTLHGKGPFAGSSEINQSLLLLQVFLNIFSVTGLVVATSVLDVKKGEKSLASHEERFRALIEKSFDAVVLIDITSKILYASPSVQSLLGYNPEELEGTTGFDLVHPDDRGMTMKALAELVTKPNGVVTVEYRTIRKDHQIIWVEATGTNLLLNDNVRAVVVNFHDITEREIARKKLLQEKVEDDAMLESIGEGMIATDETGKITIVNNATCHMLGYERDELIGKNIVDDIAMLDEKGHILPTPERPMTQALSSGKKIASTSTYYQKKDLSKIPIRFTVTPIMLEGNIIGTIEVFDDITKEKEIDTMKDEFIAYASHELRTPMTAIKGFVSMILAGDYGQIQEPLKRPLHNIGVSTDRQIALINDILDLSRIQSGRVVINTTDIHIHPVLQEVVTLLQPIIDQKGINFTIKGDSEDTARGDVEKVKQILNNLIGNALKFTKKGSIDITHHVQNNLLLVSVRDTGIGIPKEDIKKLFGKFERIGGKENIRTSGTGLRLFLSRKLARKMGGDIWLDHSVQGQGSTFIFSLPSSPPSQPSHPTTMEFA